MVMGELKDHRCPNQKCNAVGKYSGREASFELDGVTWWVVRCTDCNQLECFQFAGDGVKHDSGWREAVVYLLQRSR